MIISLDSLKALLGIADDDISHDAHLTSLIVNATAWVEGEVHLRFDVPILRTEIRKGTGRLQMYVDGHVDVSDPAGHPTFSVVTVDERLLFGDWVPLDLTAFELDATGHLGLLRRIDDFGWSRSADYRITYYDGFIAAPLDIQSLVTSLCTAQYQQDTSASDGSAGLTSETLVGVYSYTIDRKWLSTDAGGVVGDYDQKTLNRWKRRFA